MSENVISLADRKKKEDEEKAEAERQAKLSAPEYDFAADMERNKKLAERKAKERLNANKGVLRSYRIKN